MSERSCDNVTCALCERRGVRTTRHHLIPQSRERHAGIKRSSPDKPVVDLCRPCHASVHAVLSEKALQREYHTIEALRSHPDVRRFVEWIRDKPADLRVRTRRPAARRR